MIRTLRGWAARAALALAVTAGGCAGTGWDDVLYGGGGYGLDRDLQGEVRGVGRRTIDLRTEDGRYASVRYDSRTDVRYRDRRYSPRALERGDVVTVRLDRTRNGELYARNVVVRRTMRETRGTYDRRGDGRRGPGTRAPDRRDERYTRTSLEGSVGRVDRSAGRFEVRGTRQGTVWATLAPRADRGVRQRLSQLREGQHVRLRGRFLSDNRFEVEGFR